MEDECAICLERPAACDRFALSCGHFFHAACITQHFRAAAVVCPVCRQRPRGPVDLVAAAPPPPPPLRPPALDVARAPDGSAAQPPPAPRNAAAAAAAGAPSNDGIALLAPLGITRAECLRVAASVVYPCLTRTQAGATCKHPAIGPFYRVCQIHWTEAFNPAVYRGAPWVQRNEWRAECLRWARDPANGLAIRSIVYESLQLSEARLQATALSGNSRTKKPTHAAERLAIVRAKRRRLE